MNGFHIVTVLKGQNCKGMAEIMDSGVRDTDFFCNLFESQIGTFRYQVMPDFVGEYQSLFVLALILPCFPCAAGYPALHDLLAIA